MNAGRHGGGRPVAAGLSIEPRRHGDRGSGVVLVLGVVAVALGVVLAVAALGGATVARHRAEAGADLAALAAISAGPPARCDVAEVEARASGARLVGCRELPDGSVVVEATADLSGWAGAFAGGLGPRARARAGRSGAAGPAEGAAAIDHYG